MRTQGGSLVPFLVVVSVVEWSTHVRRFQQWQELRGRSQEYIYECGRTVRLLGAFLEDRGYHLDPAKVRGEWVLEFLRTYDYSPQNVRHYSAVINVFLKHNENYDYEHKRVELPRVDRINVDWLSPTEANAILEACRDSMERATVHLGLCLLLRRAEILRLRVQDLDFRQRVIHVLGKARGGGKWRTVSFHPDTGTVLSEWNVEREKRMLAASERGLEVPDSLFIYYRRGRVGSYKRTSMDNIAWNVGSRAKVKFSWHTLRRTGGRMLYKAEVPIETICTIMGHSDTRMTLQYLGVTLSDQDEAMTMYKRYMDSLLAVQKQEEMKK